MKGVFYRTKPHINIGTIGHIDHGKTTLTSAITNVLSLFNTNIVAKSFKDIDSIVEEQLRGITIQTSHIEYETSVRHYTHIDCPGHADYIKNMITGVAQMDAAILVVSAIDGPMPQTREHILLAKQIGINHIIVFINKIDLIEDDEIINLIELELNSLLIDYGYESNNVVCVSGSAIKALEDIHMYKQKSISNFTDSKWIKSIINLLDVLDTFIPLPKRQDDLPFLMTIEDIFSITGRGTVVTGRVDRGIIYPLDSVELIGYNFDKKVVVVNTLEMFNKTLDYAKSGDNIGVLLKGIQKNEVRKGMVLTKPNILKAYDEFEATVYVLTFEEGGRKKPFLIGYKPQFYIRTTDITGTVLDIKSSLSHISQKMALPGDNIILKIKLFSKLALEIGLRFVIREGGFTIGAGVITNFCN